MKKQFLRCGFCLLLAAVLCVGGVMLLHAKTVTSYEPADTLETGMYTMVLKGITPTDQPSGAYYMTLEAAQNPGMKYAAFSEENAATMDRWQIEKVSDTSCTIRNPALGDNGYLNMTTSTLTYGARQVLSYRHNGSTCVFYITSGGTDYFIRFTNGGDTKEPRFTSGSGQASYQFYLYTEISYNEEEGGAADLPLPDKDPLLTLACVSDLHCDYGLQSRSPYIRKSFITTCTALSKTEKADVLLVAGDMTSDNARLAPAGGWNYDIFRRVINQYELYAGMATVTGQSLWCCGNHDYQAGEYDNYDSYADYEDLMREGNGEPVSVYRQKNDSSLSDQKYPEHILGMHYVLNDFDFIILNAPYARSQTYSAGTLSWLSKTLKGIGADKTVFLLTHFPLYNSRHISTPSYGVSGSDYDNVFAILKNYPNLIYLYGHNHGGGESVYIADDTFERITSYTKTGSVVNGRNTVPTSFITSFVGSVSYYNYSLNPQSLGAEDPEIVQALMIYVYDDRVVFQTKNYGNAYKTQSPKSWTVLRTVYNEANGAVVTPGTDDPDTPTPQEEVKFLLSDELFEGIRYEGELSVRKITFADDAVTLKSYSTLLTGAKESLNGKMQLSLRNLNSAESRKDLAKALDGVVSDFSAYEITVKQDGAAVSPAGPLRVTLRIPAEMEKTEEPLAVYYLSPEGALTMTDADSDGKMLTFILPSTGSFAVSARANVAGDPDAAPGNRTDLPSEEGGVESWVWIVVIAAVVICGAAAVICAVLLRKPKSSANAQKPSEK